MLTLGQAKGSRKLVVASGVCADSDDFREMVNDAVRMGMNRGGFWGTVVPINVCVYNGCITWNRYVDVPLAINACGRSLQVHNNWDRFVSMGHSDVRTLGFGWNGTKCWGNVVATNDSFAPVFNNIPCGTPRYIRAYTSVRADIGKKIRIFGLDYNNQVIRTKNSDGDWEEGVSLTLPDPSVSAFVSTSFTLNKITRAIKEETQGVLRLFQYDPTDNTLYNCAVYDPQETHPEYATSKISNLKILCCCNCENGLKTVQALVKLKFVKAVHDNDLLGISNLDALTLLVQAGKSSEAGEDEDAEKKIARAVHELNLEMSVKFPQDQIPIEVAPFGTALLRRAGIGNV